MFCYKCGKELLDNASFCSYCGTKVEIPLEKEEPVKNEDKSIATEDKSIVTEDKSATIVTESISTKESADSHQDKLNEPDNKENSHSKNRWGIVTGIIIMVIAKVFGKAIAHDRSAMRFLSYAIPGLVCGLLLGIIPYVVLIKCTSFEHKTSYLVMILLGGGIVGLIGGLMFAVPYAIILSVAIFALHKINNKDGE